MSLKNPLTPPGIDPGTVRLVAQRLNHYATPGPNITLRNIHFHNTITNILVSLKTIEFYITVTTIVICLSSSAVAAAASGYHGVGPPEVFSVISLGSFCLFCV